MKKVKIETSFDVYDAIEEFDTPIQNLIQKAAEARKKAYAPYSKFLVGAALELENGEIISGKKTPPTLLDCVPNAPQCIMRGQNFQIKKYFAWQLWQDLPLIQPPNQFLLVARADRRCPNMK